MAHQFFHRRLRAKSSTSLPNLSLKRTPAGTRGLAWFVRRHPTAHAHRYHHRWRACAAWALRTRRPVAWRRAAIDGDSRETLHPVLVCRRADQHVGRCIACGVLRCRRNCRSCSLSLASLRLRQRSCGGGSRERVVRSVILFGRAATRSQGRCSVRCHWRDAT
jgi:hypothetical protein